MKTLKAEDFDRVIRVCLYMMAAWLPYSTAAIEISVVTGLAVWIAKRVTLAVRACRVRALGESAVALFLRHLAPPSSALNLPIFLFLGACLVSVGGSAFFVASLRGLISKTLEWFVIYFLAVEALQQPRHIRKILTVMVITAGFSCLDALGQYYCWGKDLVLGITISRGGAVTAAFKHANCFAAFLSFVVPLTMALWWAKTPLGRYGRWVLPAALWVLFLTFSRGAWLGTGVGLVAALWMLMRLRKTLLAVVAVSGLMLLMVVGHLSLHKRQQARIDGANVQATVDWRQGLWEDTLVMIADRPFFGHGINIYMNLFQEYRRKAQGQFEYSPSYAHNCYLQLAAETGWVGLGTFMMILTGFGLTTVRALRGSRGCQDFPDGPVYLIGLAGGMLAFLLHSFVDTQFYSLQLSTMMWLMLGTGISTARLLKDSPGYDKGL